MRFVYRTLNAFRYNPLGLTSLNRVGVRYRVFDDERLHYFEKGGHLGNLHREDVTDRIMESLMDLAPEKPGPD